MAAKRGKKPAAKQQYDKPTVKKKPLAEIWKENAKKPDEFTFLPDEPVTPEEPIVPTFTTTIIMTDGSKKTIAGNYVNQCREIWINNVKGLPPILELVPNDGSETLDVRQINLVTVENMSGKVFVGTWYNISNFGLVKLPEEELYPDLGKLEAVFYDRFIDLGHSLIRKKSVIDSGVIIEGAE